MRMHWSRCNWQRIRCQSILLKLDQCLLTCCRLVKPDQLYCLLWLLVLLARLHQGYSHTEKMASLTGTLQNYCASHTTVRKTCSCKYQKLSHSSLYHGRKCYSSSRTFPDRLCPISARVSLALVAAAPPFSWSPRRSSASLTPKSSCPCNFKL